MPVVAQQAPVTPPAAKAPVINSELWTRSNLPTPAEYECRRANGEMKIDGALDEAAWRAAPDTGIFYLFGGKRKGEMATRAKMLWDDNNLYIAMTVTDPDIRATRMERDDDIYNESCVEFFVMEQHFGSKYNHYLEYEINPLGARTDLYNTGVFEGNLNWDSRGWRSAVKVDGTVNNGADRDRGWTVEMVIPFFDFYATPFRLVADARAYYNKKFAPNPGDKWRANFYRINAVGNNFDYLAWSPTHMSRSMGFHEIDRFGTIAFSGKDAGAS